MKKGDLETLSKERILSIDVMRGIAILGIFLVNMFAFHTPFQYGEPLSFAESKSDRFVYYLVDFFAQASFYPLFAFLFGYGLIILQERMLARGQNFKAIAFRRMTVLLVIGIIHAFFIWSGDILITYAVLGFLLILVINMSSRSLLLIASLLYLIPSFLLLLLLILGDILVGNINQGFYDLNKNQITEVYQNGSFLEITMQRISDWAYTNLDGALILAFTVFPLLLFGVVFAKEKLLMSSDRNRDFFKKMLVISLPLGIIFKLAPYLVGSYLSISFFQDQIGGVTLTMAYISMIYLLCNLEQPIKFLTYFANVGKLSLSNYLFQSIVCTLIFYSYGLGLYGQVSYTTSSILAIFIFIFQLILSQWWLKYFRQGPLEWIWRGLTYGHFLKNKRKRG